MTLLIVSIVLSVVTLSIILGIAIYAITEGESPLNLLWGLLSPLWMLLLLFGSFCKVGANEVGIIYDDRSGVLDETIGEGFGTKSIFWHITKIGTYNRTAKVTTTGQTNDGQYATFELSIVYKIESANAGKFYKQTNNTELNQDQLETLVKQSLQSSTINYDIFNLLSEGLETARIDFENTLRDSLMTNYHVTLVSTSFDDVDAGENIETILQQKAEAEQKIEIAKKEAEADLITAENQVKIAEQEAVVKQTLADAEAYAVKTKGEADAETATAYVNKINDMITNIQDNTGLEYKESAELVLSIVFYDTWNGELPQVLTSDSLSSLIGSLLANNNQNAS